MLRIQCPKLPESDRSQIDQIPLLGLHYRDDKRFTLGALVDHKGMMVDEVINSSVLQYCENISFSKVGDIQKALTQCGLEPRGFNYSEIAEMMTRRHNIVHRADADDTPNGIYTNRVRPISISTLNLYVTKVRALQQFVSEQLVPVEYLPRTSFNVISDDVFYFLDESVVSRRDFLRQFAQGRTAGYSHLSDLLTIGLIWNDSEDDLLRANYFKIDDANKIFVRFCQNHVVYKLMEADSKFRDLISEGELIDLILRTCQVADSSGSTWSIRAKNLITYFLGFGALLQEGRSYRFTGHEFSTKNFSFAYSDAHVRRKLSVFHGDSPAPTVLAALSSYIEDGLSRDEVIAKHGPKAVTSIAKFGLTTRQGRLVLPSKLEGLTPDKILRTVTPENPVIKFVMNLLKDNPEMSAVNVGHEVALKFNKPWVRSSKRRNGIALIDWAIWLNPKNLESKDSGLLRDPEALAKRLKAMKRKDFGTLDLLEKYGAPKTQGRPGRRALIGKPLLTAIEALREDGMTMGAIADRIGISRTAIYRAIERNSSGS